MDQQDRPQQEIRQYGLGGLPIGGYAVEPMWKSDSIAKLAEALSKAQKEIRGAAKDQTNPYFKSKYADLNSVWEAIREPLTKNGLSVTQLPGSENGTVSVTTVLMHSSGEWVSSTLGIRPVKADPQGVGSALTYARRYALSAIAGVCPEDDDGNEATKPAIPPKRQSKQRSPQPEELEEGYARNMEKGDLPEARAQLLGKMIGEGKFFGSKVLDAKKWVKDITGKDLMALDKAEIAKVEAELKDIEGKAK